MELSSDLISKIVVEFIFYMLGSESELFSKFVEKSLLNLFLSQKNNKIYQFIERTNVVVTKVNKEIAQNKCYYVVNT